MVRKYRKLNNWLVRSIKERSVMKLITNRSRDAPEKFF